MKKIFIVTLVCCFVLYLSSSAFAQNKGGGRGPGSIPEVSHGGDHGNHADHDRPEAEKQAHNNHPDRNFEARIEENSALKTKIESLLPAGTDLKTAANGFKNEGQFIAALHVSKNLNIPFDQLKMKMTGPNAMSLGKAIQALKPSVPPKDADKEADKAEKEAKADETKTAKPVT